MDQFRVLVSPIKPGLAAETDHQQADGRHARRRRAGGGVVEGNRDERR
jgi:hypothetical protein